MTTNTTPDSSPPSPPESPTEYLVRQLYGMAAVRRELGKAALRELPVPGLPVLAALHKRGGTGRVTDLASDLQIDLSVASRQGAGLVSAGLLERRPDPADGRAHALCLTSAGLTLLQQAHHQMAAVLAETLADWDPRAITALADGLHHLIESFALPPTPAPAPPTLRASTETTDREVAA